MPDSQVVSLAERLRTRRSELGLSQAQAARELDVARTAYRLWEMEAARPSPDRWRLISRWLGVSVTTMLLAEELLSEDEAAMSTTAEAAYPGNAASWDLAASASAGDFFAQARDLIAQGIDAGYLTNDDAEQLTVFVSRIEEQRLGDHHPTQVWEPAELRKNYRPTDAAPSLARQAIAAVAGDIPSSPLWSTQLLTSELITNSLVHGASGSSDTIALVIEVEREILRVEVSERAAAGTPERKAPTADGGYGLTLVDELSSRWGTYREGQRNVTWFEVDLPAPGAS